MAFLNLFSHFPICFYVFKTAFSNSALSLKCQCQYLCCTQDLEVHLKHLHLLINSYEQNSQGPFIGHSFYYSKYHVASVSHVELIMVIIMQPVWHHGPHRGP